MLRVFADAGLQAQRSLADGVYDLTFPLPADDERRAGHHRGRSPRGAGVVADAASMRPWC